MELQNNLYEELRNYVKEHNGFGSELWETDLYKKYLKLKEDIRVFENKRVKIEYSYTADLLGGSGFRIGKIKTEINKNNEVIIKFYDGLNRTKFYWLDLGLFEGWYATLILKSIREVTGEEFKQYLKEQKAEKEKRKWGF